MATGVSQLYYINKQPTPSFNLEIDNSYFLVKLHDTQAFFQTGWLSKADFMTLSSSVESSFQPGSPTQSLHKISAIQKNTPCRLGIGTNLTDWLPVSAGGTLQLSIKYTVLQDRPIKNLIAQMEQANLVAKLSLKAEWAAAIKVSSVVGKLLSYLVQEGKKHEIFALTTNLNMVDLKTGYYVVLGSHTDEPWNTVHTFLKIDENALLTDSSADASLSRLSYAVIQVLGLKRLQQEEFREESWWQLLQTVKDNILDTKLNSEPERQKLLGEWHFVLKYVRELANKRREFLMLEIQDILCEAQAKVQEKLNPKVIPEAAGDDELPYELQDILGVKTEQELGNLVRDYQDALELSQQLLKHYE